MRVLVVEDDPGVSGFLAQGFREHGYAVDVVSNGEDALAHAAAAPYDLIVLDVMLPGRDGLAVCSELRGRRIGTPVVMLTARDAVSDRIAGLDCGADDYLIKPFAFDELLARMRALLRRGHGQTSTLLSVADLTLDPVTRRVERACKQVLLSPKEYALLDYLMRNAGRPLSRTQILEHVWDFSFEGNENVLEVYINYLRRKVDAGRAAKLIHTVRGVGYVLERRE